LHKKEWRQDLDVEYTCYIVISNDDKMWSSSLCNTSTIIIIVECRVWLLR